MISRMKDISLSRALYLLVVVGGLLATAFFCQTFVKGHAQQALPLLAFVVAICCSVRDRDKLHITFGSAALLLFYFWAAVDQNMAFRSGITTTMCMTWILAFGCTLGVSLILGNADKRKWITFFWGAILGAGLFYAVITIICWLSPSFHDAIFRRFFSELASAQSAADWKAGFTSHYSTNGMYLALGLMGCIPLLSNRDKNLGFRIVPLMVILVALLLTTKRAHLVFGVASLALALILLGSREKLSTAFKVIIVAALAAAALYVASFYAPDLMDTFNRIAQLKGNNDAPASDRALFTILCQEIWGTSPAIGTGMGSYAIKFNMTGSAMSYMNQGYTIMYAHNCFWQVLAEQGVIGFALLILAFGVNLLGSIRLLLRMNRRDAGNRQGRSALAASIALQLFFVMYCATGNPLYDMQTYIPYLFSVGVYLAVRRQAVAGGILVAKSTGLTSRRYGRPVPDGALHASASQATKGRSI